MIRKFFSGTMAFTVSALAAVSVPFAIGSPLIETYPRQAERGPTPTRPASPANRWAASPRRRSSATTKTGVVVAMRSRR